MNHGESGAQLEKIFTFVGVFAFTLIFPFFPFSFSQLVVMASLPFLHVIWAAFLRKSPFVFGLMLAFRLAILQPLSFPKYLPLPLPRSSLPLE